MPNFLATQQKLDSINKAAMLLNQLKTIYGQCLQTQGSIELYQAGTDATFNQTINSIFTSAERSELAQMLTQISNLVDNWEANHATLLGITQ